ncbi:MAG TPA: CHRD domain-containing protein [Gammaproteobacteria bacterium]
MERWQTHRVLLLLFSGSLAFAASAQDYDYGDDIYGDDVDGGIVGGDSQQGLIDDDDATATSFVALLRGIQEVPSISSAGQGEFSAELDEAASMITYTLTYEGLENVEQAHIHVGQVHTNGGISVFLCTNLENGPPDTQTCPEGTAEITGTIMAAQVIGPADQGLDEGEFEELVAAMRAEAAYANVHTTGFPAGEIRGQIDPEDDDDLDDPDDDL